MRREHASRSSNQFSTVCHLVAAVMAVALPALSWSRVTRGEEPVDDPNAVSEKEKSDRRMKFMLQALDRYTVEYPGEPPQISRLHPKPLLRWSNPLTTIRDGALVIYAGAGRPDLVCEFHVHNENYFGHEFSPIRYEGMRLKRDERTVFAADNGWFKFQDAPDAPRPSDKAVQRVAQMRQIAERFTVVDLFGGKEDQLQHYVLRLMPQPVYRYEEADPKVDGAVFVFAQGTNPEAVLLVEAVGEGQQASWRYGFAPTTMYELTAHLGGEEGPVVWKKPRFRDWAKTSGPYTVSDYVPGPNDISLKGMMPDRKPQGEPANKQ